MRSRYLALVAAAQFAASSLVAADRAVEPIRSRIRREAVESTALVSVGYSKRLRALELEFHDGRVYRYMDVDAATFHGLLEADSKARFYNEQIRGKYHCLRVKQRAGE